jgi:uncharacterized membrane protein (DUF441 family)
MLFFLFGTAFATMALGQHYFIDLVVSVPLMLAFHAAAVTSLPLTARERFAPIAAGIGVTFAWLAFLRYGVGLCLARQWLSPSLVLTTVVGAVLLESWLWKKAESVANAHHPAATPFPECGFVVNAS